jgi:predicted DNA binding CopG/RHH family protein
MAKKRSGSETRQKGAFIGFRAAKEELEAIDTAADRAGLTRSAYIRF